MGFYLNQQKTEKPMPFNICCSRANQLVTKNPPDRVVMSCSLFIQDEAKWLFHTPGFYTVFIHDHFEEINHFIDCSEP